MKKAGRFMAVSLVIILLISTAFFCSAYSNSAALPETPFISDETVPTYDEYYSSISKIKSGNSTVSAMALKTLDETNGRSCININADETVDFKFFIPEDGRYLIKFEYCISDSGNRDVDFSVLVDGGLPFEECQVLKLERSFEVDGKAYKTDLQGNQYIPDITAENIWQETVLVDRSYFIYDGLQFGFKSGEHILSVSAASVGFSLATVKFVPAEYRILSYDKYLENIGTQKGRSEAVTVEAEFPTRRNSRSVSAFCDRSSAATSPKAEALQVLNALGGSTWSKPGQSATWKFDVKSDGWYQINLKYRQDYTGGMFVSRRIKIDGEIPFEEVSLIEFPYNSGWNNLVLSDTSGNPYLFWLSKGSHTVCLEATTGRTTDIIKKVSEIIERLNECYRKIILQTSANPDPYRDYLLDEKIPDVIEEMSTLSNELENVSDELTEIVGKRGSENGIIERVAIQVNRIAEKPEKIPSGLSQFQSNISSLGTWVLERSNQALDIDYINFLPESESPQKASSGFIKEIVYGFSQFLYSFIEDYLPAKDSSEPLEVWVSAGRDQTAEIRNLAEEDFITDNGGSVQIKMVQAAALLPAVVAGIGPDVTLYADNAEPMNFASRLAVLNLTDFDNFDSISKRFAKGAFNPYTYADKVYALPEQQTFPVLFYRTDILSELNITLPDTWSDVYGVIVELSKNNMQFGLSSAIGGYCLLLYQNDGALYTDNGKASGLDSPAALNAFRAWTQFFSQYKLPVAYDFVNRFRSGEMPIAVQDYTAYNTLEVFAPEIKGKWSISAVPGTPSDDGSLNRSVASGGTACFILADTTQPQKAWEFICWWTSADIQSKFGQRVEDKLGAAARYPTANIEASSMLPWSNDFYAVLSEQWNWVIGTPEVPGGYFTGRHLNNAFRSVVYKNADSTETMLEYVKTINEEIDEKQLELSGNLEANQ